MAVTKAQARKVERAVRAKFKAYGPDLDTMVLKAPEDNFSGHSGWELVWEAGPYEWTYRVSGREVKVPGVYAEPYNTFVLGIYEE